MLDLLPEAAAEIGTVTANGFFYLGVLFFALVVHIIPEPEVLVLGNTEPPPRIEVTAIAGPPAAAAAVTGPDPTRGTATAARPGVTMDTLSTRRSAQLSEADAALLAVPPKQQRGPLPPLAPGAAGAAAAAAVKENGFHNDR
jgi:ZIP family zinc transporter